MDHLSNDHDNGSAENVHANNHKNCVNPAYLNRLSDNGVVVYPLYGIDFDNEGKPRCRCGDPECAAVGKHPRLLWSKLTKPLDRRDIEWWWGHDKTTGWAIHLGLSHLCVVEMDPRNGGVEDLERLITRYGPLPTGMEAVSGSGGRHFYFHAPGNLPPTSQIFLARGLEFLSGKRGTVIPPSPHKSSPSARYQWVGDAIQPGQLPSYLLELACQRFEEIQQARQEKIRQQQANHPEAEPSSELPRGDPGTILERARRYIARMNVAVSGQNGHGACYAVARVLIQGFALSINDALPLIREYSNRCLPPWSEKNLLHKLESAERRGGQRGYLLQGRRRRGTVDDEIDSYADVTFTLPSGKVVGPNRSPESPEIVPPPPVVAAPVPPAGPSGDGWGPDDADYSGLREAMEEARAELARWEADASARLRDINFHRLHDTAMTCRNTFRIMIADIQTHKGMYLDRRCQNWSCPGCRRLHCHCWKENFHHRLSKAEAEGFQLHSFYCTRNEWEKRLKWRVRELGADYFRTLVEDKDHYLVIADQLIGGVDCVPVTKQEAMEALVPHLEDPRWDQRHVFSSRGWKKLAPQPTPPKNTVIGPFSADLPEEKIREISTHNGVGYMVTGPPARLQPWVTRLGVFQFPAKWGLGAIQWFYTQLAAGECLTRWEDLEDLEVTMPGKEENKDWEPSLEDCFPASG